MDGSKPNSLPPEIRNRVYELALVHDGPLPIYSTSAEGEHRQQRLSALLALPHTCAKIREESTNVFYGRNSFEFDVSTVRQIPDLATKFMGSIDQDGAQYVRRLVFKCDGFKSRLTMSRLRRTLNELRIVSARLRSMRWASTCDFLLELVLIFGCACLTDQRQEISIDLQDLSASFKRAIADLERFVAKFWDEWYPRGCLIGRVQECLNVFIGMKERMACGGAVYDEVLGGDELAAIDLW